MARTAVIAGTATAVSENVAGRHAAKARQQAAVDQAVADRTVAQPRIPAQPVEEDFLAGLQKLAELKRQGLLSDEEFAAAKARLLGG
jgi:hypothetical protein